jgi:hypothetical protein
VSKPSEGKAVEQQVQEARLQGASMPGKGLSIKVPGIAGPFGSRGRGESSRGCNLWRWPTVLLGAAQSNMRCRSLGVSSPVRARPRWAKLWGASLVGKAPN